MKSIYYAAVVTRAYRKALDALEGRKDPNLSAYREDLFNVSHREYSTGFFFEKSDIEKPTEITYQRRFVFLGSVLEAVPESPGLFKLDVKNQILTADSIQFVGPDIPFIEDTSWELLMRICSLYRKQTTERAILSAPPWMLKKDLFYENLRQLQRDKINIFDI